MLATAVECPRRTSVGGSAKSLTSGSSSYHLLRYQRSWQQQQQHPQQDHTSVINSGSHICGAGSDSSSPGRQMKSTVVASTSTTCISNSNITRVNPGRSAILHDEPNAARVQAGTEGVCDVRISPSGQTLLADPARIVLVLPQWPQAGIVHRVHAFVVLFRSRSEHDGKRKQHDRSKP